MSLPLLILALFSQNWLAGGGGGAIKGDTKYNKKLHFIFGLSTIMLVILSFSKILLLIAIVFWNW
jgi:hypothetical protein